MIKQTIIDSRFGIMPRIWYVVVIFCAFILCSVSVGAEESTPRSKLKVGFFQFDGYHIIDADGERSGYGYDLLQMLRSYANWEYQYIGYEAGWPAMLPMLKRGELDLVTSVTMTPERLIEFDFSDKPIGYAGVVMTVKAGNERYKLRDYKNWNNMRVGIISENSKNDAFSAFAKEKNFSYQEVPFLRVEDLNQALQDGSIDAAVTGSLRRMKNEWIYEQLNYRPFYIAVKKGNSALLSEVNRAIAKLEIDHPGFADVLFNTYYIDQNYENSEVYFSAGEQAFLRDILAEQHDFKLLVKPDNPPFWTGENKKYHGILYDIFCIVKKRTGLNISVLPVKSISEYNDILAQGTPDFVLDMRCDFSYAEQLGYVLTDPYLAGAISIVTRRDFSGSPKNVGVIQGSDIENVMRKHNKSGRKLKSYSSMSELIEAVKNGNCDGCGIYTRTAENIIMNDAANSLKFVPTGLGFNFAVGVNEKYDRHLLSVIQKGLQSISAEDMRQLLVVHNAHEIRRQSYREFLAEYSLTVFMIAGGILLCLSTALFLVLLSRRKVQHAHARLEQSRQKAAETAEWLKKTLISIGDAVIVTNVHGDIVLLNPVAEKLTGWSSEEAGGHPHEEILKIVSYLDDTPVDSPVTKVLATKEVILLSNHTDLISRSGTRYHIADSAAPILGQSGDITGVIIVFRDVTNEYNMKEQLRFSLAGMEYAAELSRSAYFCMAVHDRSMLAYSKEFPELWPVEDGKAIQSDGFVCQEDIPGNEHIYQELIAGKCKVAELRYRAFRNQQIRDYQIRATLDKSDPNKPLFTGVIQDITELADQERRLADMLNLWHIVLNAIPIMIFAKDVENDYRYLISNREFEQFIGKSHDEIIGVSDVEIIENKKDLHSHPIGKEKVER